MRTLTGALLWCLFLLLTLLLVIREERRRLREYRGLCRLISHIREAISSAPAPLSEIYAAFRDDTLRHTGFLDVLTEQGLSAALASDTLHLDGEETLPFRTYAEGLGTRLYAEEVRAAEELLSTVSLTCKEKEAAYPRKERLTATLFLAGGLLILLLLI